MIEFSDELIKKMKDTVIKSNATNEDMCFSLCLKDKNILDRDHRTEKECNSTKELKCPNEEIPIGFYRVYPHRVYEEDIPNPNSKDLILANRYGMTCIGTTKDIECFQRKGDFNKNLDNELSATLEELNKLTKIDEKLKKDLSIFIYKNMKIISVRNL